MSDGPSELRKQPRRRRVRRGAALAVLVVCCVVLIDIVSGCFYRTSDDASVAVTNARSSTTGEALLVFGGYASDCTATSEALAPNLESDTAMVVLCYAERGIDDDQVFEVMSEQLELHRPDSVRILAGSLGGMVAVRFLERYRDSPLVDVFGPVVLVLDTAPSSSRSVRRPQWLFSLCSWYRGGIVSSGVWFLMSGLGDDPEAERGAATTPIETGARANAAIGMPALTSQADYLGSFDPDEIEGVADVIDRAAYLEGAPADADPLVAVDDAVAVWSEHLPGMRVVQLPERHGDWHIPWTARPAETLAAATSV